MKRELIPTWEEMAAHQRSVPEIAPAAVVAMLELKEAGEAVQEYILSVLQREYHLSEGKFCVLILLHQSAEGLAPSQLAKRVGVTKATVSAMLGQLTARGLVCVAPDANDARAKHVCLTAEGVAFMQEILPTHYLRVTKLMEGLTEEEQRELVRLLRKLRS